MLNFNFLLDGTTNPNNGFSLAIWGAFFVMVVFMIVTNSRNNKKKQQEINTMRDNLTVGDEITTIGGIIGKVVSIKEDTFVLETTKDRTKIRFHKYAISSVDVSVAEIAAAQSAEKAESTTEEK